MEGVSTLRRYYCQLLFLKNRFKVGSDWPFQFSWRDIYSGTDYSVSDVSHELAAVMYNIGALHSRLGVGEDRQDSDGMKMAVAHFQCAAWAFHTLPDQFPQDSDLSSELMAFKSQLCLAQAQECILEKSLLDCRKPGIVTKVCGQVVEYYKQAIKHLEMSGARVSRNWRDLMDFKVLYYSSLSSLHCGLLAEEGRRWGERVAFYMGASNSLIQAGRVAKEFKLEQVYTGVMKALVYTTNVVNEKLETSKKENDVYQEKVPEQDSLPIIKGASLVKGIPFDPSDLEVSGPDLFSCIVPIEAHEASSLFNEEQAKLLSTVCGEVEVANDSMALQLSLMQPEVIPNPTFTHSLPQELVECAAGLSVRPEAVSKLEDAMAKLASRSANVEASLREIQQMNKEEEVKELEFQVLVGSRPRSLMYEMERETLKYKQAHSMALDAKLNLLKGMQFHVTNWKLLAMPINELNSNVPSHMELDKKTQDSLDDMRRIMAKVDEMKSQRAQLEEKLRAGITDSLARNGDVAQGKTFEQEMKKHNETVQLIRQNIQAQWILFRAMAEKDDVYADAKIKVEELMKKRERLIRSMVASYHAYEGLLDETTKGLEFYDKLGVNMAKLKARVIEVVKMQEEERAQQMNSSTQKAALSPSIISEDYRDSAGGVSPLLHIDRNSADQGKVLTLPHHVELGEVEVTINGDESFVNCESEISLLELRDLIEVEDIEPPVKKRKLDEEDNIENNNSLWGDHSYAVTMTGGVEAEESAGTENLWSIASNSFDLEAGLVFESRAEVRRFITGYSIQSKSKLVVSAGGASDGCSSRQVNYLNNISPLSLYLFGCKFSR